MLRDFIKWLESKGIYLVEDDPGGGMFSNTSRVEEKDFDKLISEFMLQRTSND